MRIGGTHSAKLWSDTGRLTPQMRILTAAGAFLLCAFAASAATPARERRLSALPSAAGGQTPVARSARVSGDGRFVVFSSGASNLTRARRSGLFVRDLRRRRTVRLGPGGVDRAVTPDARFVVVCTTAPLARGDVDAPYGRPPEVERFLDAYVYDRHTGGILRASVPVRGRNPNRPRMRRRLCRARRHLGGRSARPLSGQGLQHRPRGHQRQSSTSSSATCRPAARDV